MRILFLSQALLLTALLTACPKEVDAGGAKSTTSFEQVKKKGTPIATIGRLTLTTSDIAERIKKQSPFVQARFNEEGRLEKFVENQIKWEVLAAEAIERGYQDSPAAQAAVKKLIVQRLSREEYDGAVKLGDITDADIQKAFDDNKAEYNKPAMIRMSGIIIPFGNDKTAGKKKIDEAYNKAINPDKRADRAFFKSLVAQYSKDEKSRKLGGDFRYMSHQEITERFGEDALKALQEASEINDVTKVVECKMGFAIFKRTGRRKAIIRTLDEVRAQVRNKLFRDKKAQAFDDYVEKLKQKHKVHFYKDNLDKVRVVAPTEDAHK